MDINWYGHSTFKLKGKSTAVVTDPFDPAVLGLKLPKLEADILTLSHDHPDHNFASGVSGVKFSASGPGEYEIQGVAFSGIASFHDSKSGEERGKNTIFNFNIDGIWVCHLGDLGQDSLTEDQVNDIGSVDVLLIPVGGVYTINAATAAKVAAQLEPKIIIPMHYQLEGLKFELDPVSHFLQEMGKETLEPQNKLAISADKLPEELQVVVLEKS